MCSINISESIARHLANKQAQHVEVQYVAMPAVSLHQTCIPSEQFRIPQRKVAYVVQYVVCTYAVVGNNQAACHYINEVQLRVVRQHFPHVHNLQPVVVLVAVSVVVVFP